MAAGRLQEKVTNEGGQYGREPLWRECVQRAGELLAPAWPSAGTATEEGDGLRVLALLLYAVSPAKGNWMPRQVPTEKLIEALELDVDGGEALIREGLAFLGHKPEDEGDWCIGTLNGMTAVRHRDYYEAVVPWDSLPSSEVPFFGSWTYFRQGAAWVQRWLKALHRPDSPDVLTRYTGARRFRGHRTAPDAGPHGRRGGRPRGARAEGRGAAAGRPPAVALQRDVPADLSRVVTPSFVQPAFMGRGLGPASGMFLHVAAC